MIKKYLEFSAKTEVILSCIVGSIALMFLMSNGMFPPSAITPLMDVATSEKALNAAAKAGELNSYLFSILTLDTLFPIVYATLLSGLIYRSYPGSHRMKIALVPVILAVWDYCENVQLALIHFLYPDNPTWLVSSAILFGKGKLIGIVICFIILTVSWLYRLFKRDDDNGNDT